MTITTADLIKHLQQLDPSGKMIVTETRHSDIGPMELENWSVEDLHAHNGGEWYTSKNYRLDGVPIKALHFSGN